MINARLCCMSAVAATALSALASIAISQTPDRPLWKGTPAKASRIPPAGNARFRTTLEPAKGVEVDQQTLLQIALALRESKASAAWAKTFRPVVEKDGFRLLGLGSRVKSIKHSADALDVELEVGPHITSKSGISATWLGVLSTKYRIKDGSAELVSQKPLISQGWLTD